MVEPPNGFRNTYSDTDGALHRLRRGSSVALESTAREVGISKPGLMYYFPTKEALMLGLVDYVALQWEKQLMSHLHGRIEEASPPQRIHAYVDFALTRNFDRTDIVMLSDPRLCEPLSARWSEQIAPWVHLPDELSADQRARLTAARLLADGAWFVGATNVFTPDHSACERLRAIAHALIEEAS